MRPDSSDGKPLAPSAGPLEPRAQSAERIGVALNATGVFPDALLKVSNSSGRPGHVVRLGNGFAARYDRQAKKITFSKGQDEKGPD
jgi:hypothetical protein